MITNKEKIDIIRRINRLLASRYKARTNPAEPLDAMYVLVASAVSPNPFRPDVKGAWRRMSEQFVDWNEVRVTMPAELAQIMARHHMPASRAGSLKKVLSGLFDHFNAVSLDFIEKLDPNPIRSKLQQIEAIRQEDIDNILLLHKRVHLLPLNGLVTRVLTRIGLVRRESSAQSIQALFKSALDRNETVRFYENLNTLAEKVCITTQPKCNVCVLRNDCLFGLVRLGVIPESEAEFPIKLPLKTGRPARKTRRKKKKGAVA